MTTEPKVVTAAGVVEAWKLATKLLVDDGDRFNLAVHITEPTSLVEAEAARFCHKRVSPDIIKSVYDVANTIFPAAGALHAGNLDAFFAHYSKAYKRGQRKHPAAWGTYFLRLTSFGRSGENQIQKILDALTGWKSRPRAAFVVHLSSTDLDNPRPLGAPCWQYAQFIRNGDNNLSLVATYRSQDYFQKALGNFIGLTRLLQFVCHHGGMTPDTLTCHATFANLQGQRTKARQLLELDV